MLPGRKTGCQLQEYNQRGRTHPMPAASTTASLWLLGRSCCAGRRGRQGTCRVVPTVRVQTASSWLTADNSGLVFAASQLPLNGLHSSRLGWPRLPSPLRPKQQPSYACSIAVSQRPRHLCCACTVHRACAWSGTIGRTCTMHRWSYMYKASLVVHMHYIVLALGCPSCLPGSAGQEVLSR